MAPDDRWRIAIETERILIVARRASAGSFCARCGREVELLPVKEVEGVQEDFFDQIDRKEGTRKVHLTKLKDGLVVCLKSLLLFLQSGRSKFSE